MCAPRCKNLPVTSFSAATTDPGSRSSRPGWREVAAVWAGGSVGCALRAAADLRWPVGVGGFPTTILMINVLGAFALGLLLELLALRGKDGGVRRRMRLLLGSGLLGGFTTYSTFAVATVELLRGGMVGTAAAYAAGTVLIGCVMAWLGIALARLLGGRSA